MEKFTSVSDIDQNQTILDLNARITQLMLECKPEDGLEGFFANDNSSSGVDTNGIDNELLNWDTADDSTVKILITMSENGDYTINQWHDPN